MSRQASALEGASSPAGCYGKIPGTGDFVVRGLPGDFTDRWDQWLRSGLRESEQRLGAGWRESFYSMPAWRFVLAPGLACAAACIGVMVPSVDAVGRLFPLTVAAVLRPQAPAGEGLDIPGAFRCAARWLEQVESILSDAIAPGANMSSVETALGATPFPAPGLQLGANTAGRSGWLTERSEVMERTLLVAAGLPSAEQFCGLMTGAWSNHGWDAPVASLEGA